MATDLGRTEEKSRSRRLVPFFFVGAVLAGWLFPTLAVWAAPLVVVAALISRQRQRWLIVGIAAVAALVGAFIMLEAFSLTAELSP